MRKGKVTEELVGTTPGKLLRVGEDLSIEEVDETTGADNLIKAIPAIISSETDDIVVEDQKYIFRIPFEFNLSQIRANLRNAPMGSSLIIDVKKDGISILSTLISIDAGTKTNKDSVNPAVISDNALTDDSEITIDIKQVGSTVTGTGLKVWFIGKIANSSANPDPEPSVISIDGLISYYKLDYNEGDVIDSYGTRNGTNLGGIRGVAGKLDSCFSFPGNAFVNTGYLDAPEMAENYSIMAWFKTSSENIGQIVSRDGSVRFWQFRMDADGRIRFIRFNSTGIAANFATPLSYNDGEWHFACITFDSEVGSKIYINGSQKNSDDDLSLNKVAATGEQVLIGAQNLSEVSECFTGEIDEVAIYKRTLTPTEITNIYNEGEGVTL